MPWDVHVDPKQRVSYARLSGLVTFGDIVAMQRKLAIHPLFDARVPLVIDMRHAQDLRLTWPEIQEAIHHSPLDYTTKRAVILDEMDVLGTARVYEMAHEHKKENISLRIFRNVEEAAEWLGVKTLTP
jgi:hypothetical protein